MRIQEATFRQTFKSFIKHPIINLDRIIKGFKPKNSQLSWQEQKGSFYRWLANDVFNYLDAEIARIERKFIKELVKNGDYVIVVEGNNIKVKVSFLTSDLFSKYYGNVDAAYVRQQNTIVLPIEVQINQMGERVIFPKLSTQFKNIMFRRSFIHEFTHYFEMKKLKTDEIESKDVFTYINNPHELNAIYLDVTIALEAESDNIYKQPFKQFFTYVKNKYLKEYAKDFDEVILASNLRLLKSRFQEFYANKKDRFNYK